jgi:hypothetical protein
MNFLKYLNFPVIFSGTNYLPPATPLNYVAWTFVCFIFNHRIRRRHFDWWSKYNCELMALNFVTTPIFDATLLVVDILSSSLSASYAISCMTIFFVLQYPKNGTIGLNSIQKWWGNVVYTNTADYRGVPLKTVPNGETFGPSTW